MKNKKWLIRLIGIAILGYILFRVDFRSYYELLKKLEPLRILFACLLILVIYLLKSFRWYLLLKGQGIVYSYLNSFLAFTGSNFIAFITPGRLGEFAKIFYLRQDVNTPVSRSLPSVITDRLFDVYVLLFFGVFGIIKIGLGNNILIILFVVIAVFAPLLLFNRKIFDLWTGILIRLPFISRAISKKQVGLENLKQEFQKLININLLYALFLSLISYLLLYYVSAILATAMHVALPFTTIVLMVSVANMLSFLPITVSGLGTREAVFIFFFHRLGYTTEQALLFSTLFFAGFYIAGGIIAYICFMIKPVSIKKLKSEINPK